MLNTNLTWMINQMVINAPHWAVWMSAADEYRHSLCGSGAVDSVSIGDGVELDRLRLPSLLHVAHKENSWCTNTRAMDGARTHTRSHTLTVTHTHTHALGLVDRDWQEEETHSGAVTSWRDWYFLLNGWMWMIREMKRHKNIYIRLPDGVAALGTAPPLLVTGGITVSTL